MPPTLTRIFRKLHKIPTYVTAGIVLLLVVITLFLVQNVSSVESENFAKVQRGDLVIDLVESGEIRAVNSVFVRAPREWRMDLQIIDMELEGTIVKKGDFLVQFDTSTLDEEMDEAKDRLKQTEADLRSVDTEQATHKSEIETNIAIAKYTKEAADINIELMKYESVVRQEEARLDLMKEIIRFEETENKLETQRIIDGAERLKVALNVEQAKLNLKEMERRIDQLTLRAPISGMVVYQQLGGRNASRYKVAIGDNARPGQAVISIPDLSRMKMVAQVNEMDAGSLKIGQKVILRLDAYDTATYHGSIASVASLVDKEQGHWRAFNKAPSFEVTIIIDEQDAMLKPGMTAQVWIFLEEISDVLFVPVGAVSELEDGTSVVYTRRDFPEPVQIKMGKRNDRFVIIEKGLSATDEISLIPPTDEAYPLGWFAEMERRKSEFEEFLFHIDTMNRLGIKYTPAPKDTTDRSQLKMQPSGSLERVSTSERSGTVREDRGAE